MKTRKPEPPEDSDDDEFCAGGTARRRRGGKAEGKTAPQRLDKRPRRAGGGGVPAGSPPLSMPKGVPYTLKRGGRAEGGRLTASERQSMPKSDFALPGHGEGPKGAGAGSYPINDASHARNALARVSQHGSSAEKAEVRAAVHRKYPGIGS